MASEAAQQQHMQEEVDIGSLVQSLAEKKVVICAEDHSNVFKDNQMKIVDYLYQAAAGREKKLVIAMEYFHTNDNVKKWLSELNDPKQRADAIINLARLYRPRCSFFEDGIPPNFREYAMPFIEFIGDRPGSEIAAIGDPAMDHSRGQLAGYNKHMAGSISDLADSGKCVISKVGEDHILKPNASTTLIYYLGKKMDLGNVAVLMQEENKSNDTGRIIRLHGQACETYRITNTFSNS